MRDRHVVYAMSTLHKKTVITVLKRPKGSKEKQNMLCPQMITDYTYHMGGVDLTDQYVSYYSMSKKDVKIVEDGVLASLRYSYSKFLDNLLNKFSIVERSRARSCFLTFLQIGNHLDGW